MSTTIRALWRRIPCVHCGGHGQVARYSVDGFEGAVECSECDGSGQVCISPRDRLAKWPGGPFLGSWPGRYAEAVRRPA